MTSEHHPQFEELRAAIGDVLVEKGLGHVPDDALTWNIAARVLEVLTPEPCPRCGGPMETEQIEASALGEEPGTTTIPGGTYCPYCALPCEECGDPVESGQHGDDARFRLCARCNTFSIDPV